VCVGQGACFFDFPGVRFPRGPGWRGAPAFARAAAHCEDCPRSPAPTHNPAPPNREPEETKEAEAEEGGEYGEFGALPAPAAADNWAAPAPGYEAAGATGFEAAAAPEAAAGGFEAAAAPAAEAGVYAPPPAEFASGF
jgi:hypothetical protein